MKNSTRYKAIRIMKYICGGVLPIVFWASLIFGFDSPYIATLTIISALIHEAGHLTALKLIGIKTADVYGHFSGFRIKYHGMLSYSKEIIILLSGPLANLIIYLVTIPMTNAMNGYLQIFGFINLVTAISNMLPIEGFDGYGILYNFMLLKDQGNHIRLIELFSLFLTIALTFFSLYLINKFGNGYWIFGIFFFMTMSKLVKTKKNTVFKD